MPQKEKHSEKLQQWLYWQDVAEYMASVYENCRLENSYIMIGSRGIPHGFCTNAWGSEWNQSFSYTNEGGGSDGGTGRGVSSHGGGNAPSDGSKGSGNNGVTVTFKYNGAEYKDVPIEVLPEVLHELLGDCFNDLQQIADNPAIQKEYGVDVWIDNEGNLQTNDVANRASARDFDHYFPEPGEGTFIASLHSHYTSGAGCPSADDVVATVSYGHDFPGYTAFVISNDMVSSIQCINSKGLDNMIDKVGLNNSIQNIWGDIEHKYGGELSHSQKSFWGLLTITTYLNKLGYLNKNIFITPDPKKYKGK